MRILNEAYSVLSDPEKRKQHDRWIHEVSSPVDAKDSSAKASPWSEKSGPTTATQASISQLSSGSAVFHELPIEVQKKLRERVAGRHKEQFSLSTRFVVGNYFWLAVLCGWFWLLFHFADQFRWGQEELYWYGAISIVAAILIGTNINSILKGQFSPLKHLLIITPAYIIRTLGDHVKYWPLSALRDIKITHHYQNGLYQGSETHLHFPSGVEILTVNGRRQSEEFVRRLRTFGESLHAAYLKRDVNFFRTENDFFNFTPSPRQNAFHIPKHMLAAYSISLLAGITLFTAAYSVNVQRPLNAGIPTSPQRATLTSPQRTSFTAPALPLPLTGEQRTFVSSRGVAPLEIRTPTGSNHFIIKLEHWATGMAVKTFFIRAGQRHETLVPLGSYRIKYASGVTWYGDRYLFGPKTVYSEADRKFDFYRTADGYVGHSVELILQRHGNLRRKSISPSQW